MAKGKITTRQQAVLDGLKAKQDPADIAKAMGISTNGVYGHMRRLRQAGLIAKRGKAGRRPRATATTGVVSHNGRPTKESEIVKALRRADADAQKRLAAIANEEDALRRERESIEAARSGR